MAMLPLRMNVLIFKGTKYKPFLWLRRTLKEPDLIHAVINAALEGRPLVIIPEFRDKIKAMESLADKGIIYYDKVEKQWFLNKVK